MCGSLTTENFWLQAVAMELCAYVYIVRIRITRVPFEGFLLPNLQVYALAGKTGKAAYNLNVASKEELPMTALRFRPSSTKSKTRNVLLAVSTYNLCGIPE